MDHLCYFCSVFVMLSRLLIAALWSPAGKGLGKVWYLIVSSPDICPLSYFTGLNGCVSKTAHSTLCYSL